MEIHGMRLLLLYSELSRSCNMYINEMITRRFFEISVHERTFISKNRNIREKKYSEVIAIGIVTTYHKKMDESKGIAIRKFFYKIGFLVFKIQNMDK